MRQDVYIIDGVRTPFLKARNRPGPFAASDLATAAGRAVLTRQPFAPTELDEVILGCAAPSVDEVNIGRVVALRMGCGQQVPGWTVMRNCASGMQALDSAIANFEAGRSKLVLAGGVDALSRAPLLFSDAMVLWFADFYAARTFGQKAAALAQFRPGYLAPVIGLMRGLTDPNVGLLMGQTAENLAHRFGITRRQMDEYAARSHSRLIRAQESGWLLKPDADGLAPEIVPVYDGTGNVYTADDGVREDSRPKTSRSCAPSSTASTATSPPGTPRRSPTAGPGCCSRPRTRSSATGSSRSAASSTRSGRGSIRRRWGSARCTRRRRSCSARP